MGGVEAVEEEGEDIGGGIDREDREVDFVFFFPFSYREIEP